MKLTKGSCLALGLLISLAAAPARAGDHEFHEIVDRLAAAYHKRPMPFMGLVSFVARPCAWQYGVSGLKLAIFDEIDPALGPDPAEFDRFMQTIVGPEFYPFVRVRSKRDGEQTYIYLREVKQRAEMLLVSVDSSDAVVIKMWLKPEAMKDWIDEPVKRGRFARSETSRQVN
jgi:hypothetical protein